VEILCALLYHLVELVVAVRSVQKFLIPIILGLLATACVKNVSVREALRPNAPIPTEELVRRINSYGNVTSLSVQASILVRDYFTGEATKAREFPEGNAVIVLQRPEKIRMRVSAPSPLSKSIADMTSDGQEFRLAVFWPTDKRVFVRGSNLSELHRMAAEEIKSASDPRLRDVGALANIRPQHITDAFLIKPINSDGRLQYFREEVWQVEPDQRPGRKNRLVERPYYVLYVFAHSPVGEAYKVQLLRKFWFDRTQGGTPLVRQQTFENGDGRLASDITYGRMVLPPNSNLPWPETVTIERRSDGYSITLELERDAIEINPKLPETAFMLENTEQLKEVNLDEPIKGRAAQPLNH
jgi:hypothetical protein